MDVAVVRDDDSGLDCDEVVAAVPLLALGGVDVASGLDDPQNVDPERVGDDFDEGRVSSVTSKSPSPGRSVNGWMPSTMPRRRSRSRGRRR